MVRFIACGVCLLVITVFGATGVAAPAQQPSRPQVDPELVGFLDRTADWYRRVSSVGQGQVRANELTYRDTVTRSARQAMRLGLQFGRARVDVLASAEAVETARAAEVKPATTTAAAATAPATGPASRPVDRAARGQRIAQSVTAATARVEELTRELETLSRELDDAMPNDVALLEARREELAAQLELATARRDVLQRVASVAGGAEGGAAAALAERIDALERSVPEAAAAGSPATGGATAQAAAAVAEAAARPIFRPESTGVIGLVSEMFELSARMDELRGLADQADELDKANERFRGPARAQLGEAMRQADAVSTPNGPDTAQTLAARAKQAGELATRFRQLSAVAFPLREQGVAIQSARSDLREWRAALGRDYSGALRNLLFRLGATGAALLVVFVISFVWRRATLTYAHDVRRRRQLMLLRRIVIGVVVAIILIMATVTEFGSLATFAGIMTAGIAVALQTVILSAVAYFFFVGRYGVRAGDRVTVGGVTGDVISTGLFRLYLMEMAGGRQLKPTGRVVVFSNSVLFQPAGFFKQAPGTEYVWNEVAMTLSPESDYRAAEERLKGAVDGVVKEYRPELERQHERVKRSSSGVTMDPPDTETRLRFVDAGLEVVVRYPVEIRRSAEIDDRVTRAVLEAVEAEPKLRMVAAGVPRIQGVK
ncbi:MAG TPA: mechanosensitive ion channel family protein [Tepidisphaeraceae bacterium]|nr:mechanosensitive ion channel family protein [Tepidisphaeraceae bacterium]